MFKFWNRFLHERMISKIIKIHRALGIEEHWEYAKSQYGGTVLKYEYLFLSPNVVAQAAWQYDYNLFVSDMPISFVSRTGANRVSIDFLSTPGHLINVIDKKGPWTILLKHCLEDAKSQLKQRNEDKRKEKEMERLRVKQISDVIGASIVVRENKRSISPARGNCVADNGLSRMIGNYEDALNIELR